MERKNRIVQEMYRIMMNENKVNHRFWKEAVHIIFDIENGCMIRPHENKNTIGVVAWKKGYSKIF